MSFLMCCQEGENQQQKINIDLETLKKDSSLGKFLSHVDTIKYDKHGNLVYSMEKKSIYGKGRFGGTLYVLSEDSLTPLRKVSVYNPGYASEYHQVFIKNDSVA